MANNNLLSDYIEYISMMGKSKGIAIHRYDEEANKLILRNIQEKKVYIKVNKSSNSLDIGIFVCPYKNSSVEVMKPCKKQIRVKTGALIKLVDEVFKEL